MSATPGMKLTSEALEIIESIEKRRRSNEPILPDVRRLVEHPYRDKYSLVRLIWPKTKPVILDFLEDPSSPESDLDLAYLLLFQVAKLTLPKYRDPEVYECPRVRRAIIRGLPRKNVTLAAAGAIRLMCSQSGEYKWGLRYSGFVEALATLAERFEGMEQSDGDFLFDMIKDMYESEMSSEGFSLPPRHRQLDLVHVVLWIVLYEMESFIVSSSLPVPAGVAGVVRLGVRLGREDETVGEMACKALTLLCWDDATRREVCQPVDEGFIDSILHLASSTNSKVADRSLKCLGLIAQEQHIAEKLSNKDSLARLGQVALRESHVRTAAFLALSRVLKVNHGPALACLPPGLVCEAVDMFRQLPSGSPVKDAIYAFLVQAVSWLSTDACRDVLNHVAWRLERNPDVACKASLHADLEVVVSEGRMAVPQDLQEVLIRLCDVSEGDSRYAALLLLQKISHQKRKVTIWDVQDT